MRLNFGFAALALTLCGSCKLIEEPTPPPVAVATSWQGPPADSRPMRRVVIPPFQDLAGFPHESERIRNAFMRAVSLRQRFEVIPVGEHELREVLPASVFETGVIPRQTLISVAKRYRADGVLFGVVTHYHPYEPVALGMTIELVSAGTGEVIWQTSGLFDSAQKGVVQDIWNYHDTRLAETTSLEGWRLVMQSPSRFTDYVCARLAATLE